MRLAKAWPHRLHRCLSARCAFLLVEIDAHLCRTLKDVEELAEGQIEQREDNGDGVQLREKAVVDVHASGEWKR